MTSALAGVLIVCTIIITIAILVLATVLIITLVQIRRTAKKVEIISSQLNASAQAIGRITGSVAHYVDKLSSPWVALVSGLVSSVFIRRKKAAEEEKD